MRHAERGFTLVETLIATAIAAVTIGGLVLLAAHLTSLAARLHARADAQMRADRLNERLASEAAGAWAVFVPPADVLGIANGDGHELDFFAEDALHRPYAWAYRYDTTRGTLARYAYAPGEPPIQTEALGAFDAFVARGPFAPSALGDPTSGAYDPLFAGASVPFVAHAFAQMPNATGGNAFVVVRVRAAGVDRNETLASATAPTTFTVLVSYTPSPAPAQTAAQPLPTLTAAPASTP